MLKTLKLITFITLIFFNSNAISGEVTATINKNADNKWSVNYQSDVPIKKLVFQRNPDDSRVKRWKPHSVDFVLSYIEGIEQVTRLDGKEFSQISFDLTPTYTPLPKEYAPFSPFSDQGMLFHSGRFFACAEICDDNLNQWKLQVKAQDDDNIIVGGKIHRKEFSWLAKDNGTSVYVGKGTPLQDRNFVSLIDTHLPDTLKTLIANQLPKLITYFTKKMGALDYRPELFASHSSTSDGTYGNQGGTLPGQIFMHWYGRAAIDHINSDATFWFFAHEVAHLYQREAGNIEIAKDAWLHEGSAEYLAGVASRDISNNPLILAQKLDIATQSCLAGLSKNSNYHQASAQDSRLHYSCGLLLMNAIDLDLKQKKTIDVFGLWSLFNLELAQGKPAEASTLITLAKPYLSEKLWNDIQSFSTKTEFDSLIFFKGLATKKP